MNHIRVFRVHARGNIRRIQFGGKLYGFDSRYRLCSIGDVWLICGYTVRTRPGLHNAICFGWNIAARKTSGVENEGEREEEFRTDPYAKLCTVLCVHWLYWNEMEFVIEPSIVLGNKYIRRMHEAISIAWKIDSIDEYVIVRQLERKRTYFKEMCFFSRKKKN